MKVTVYISPPSLKPNLTTQKYKKVNGPKIRNPFIDQASPAHLLPATLFPPKTHRRSKKALIPHSPFRHHNIPQRERKRERRRNKMSGWDEGAVYYSDQPQFPEAGDAATVSPHAVMTKFKEFIRTFEIGQNCFPYREALLDNPKRLLVHLEDLLSFDSDLPSLIRSAPADFLPVV